MMSKIDVISSNQTLEGKRIRYIEFNKSKYFLYTLNEKDSEGYEKLYINKIVENEEDLITVSEWEELKKNIPTIVKQIRDNNITDFIDLSVNDVTKLNLDYSKAFKLKVNIVDSITKQEKDVDLNSEINNLLNELNAQEKSLNQLDSFLDKVDEENIELPINPDNKLNVEIEELKEKLDKQEKENEKLKARIISLNKEIATYKNKLKQIKIMIDQS